MWPLLIIAVGGIWLLVVADAFPNAVDDLLKRAWPALLILFGFDALVGRRRWRIRRWGVELSVIGMALIVALTLVVIWLAYQKQGDVVRADNVVSFAQPLEDGVNRLRLEVSLGRTTLTVAPSEAGDLRAEFRGSNESAVTMLWSVEGDTGVLTITEKNPNAIPTLKDYGRGTLDIMLPKNALIDLFRMDSTLGDIAADLSLLHLRRLEVDAGRGDITLHLPALDTLDGVLRTGDGGIELFVPGGMLLDVVLEEGSGRPQYQVDRLKYVVLEDSELRPANTTSWQYRLRIWVKSGAPVIITDVE
jgi:hypothetical protein